MKHLTIVSVLVLLSAGAVGASTAVTPADPLPPDMADPAPRETGGAPAVVPDDALIVFHEEPGRTDIERLRSLGLTVVNLFTPFRTVHVVGPTWATDHAASHPTVAGVYENKALDLHLSTSTLATNARNLWDDKTTSTPATVGGQPLDGTGVGVAVVDTGVDATHPDLAETVVSNQRWLCSTPVLVETASGYEKCFANWQLNTLLEGEDLSCLDSSWTEMANTDVDSGHGTHVASTVAGTGQASDGRFAGAAPGASIYGFGVGHGTSLLIHEALAAFDWIHCMHDQVTPSIEVVSNSWGSGSAAYDPTDPVNVAVDALVSEGITVVFSAGNAGDGTSNTVNTYARNPTPGVISVANYDDLDRASLTGQIDASSSRCLEGSAAIDCPDLAAPGTAILAARASTSPLTTALGNPLSGDGRYTCCTPSTLAYSPYYAGMTGTSMAAPHVSGVAALVLQANPSLTPADVEDILEDTALQFPGPSYDIEDDDNPTTEVSPSAGHGLLDARAAVADARVLGTPGPGSDLPKVRQGPHVETAGFDGQILAGAQWTVPAGEEVTLAERSLASGDTDTYPLGRLTGCGFLVDGVTFVPCANGHLERSTSGWDMHAPWTFDETGEHRVEAQLDFGSGFVSFDAFTVRVVG